MRESPSVYKFLDVIEAAKDKTNSRTDASTAGINYILSLSDRKLKKLISDSYWSRYPFYTCWPNRTGRRSHGSTIGMIVGDLCQYNYKMKNFLMTKSDGIFLCFTIDSTYGKDRIKASSKAMRSKDTRARLRAAKVLPVSMLKKCLNDSSSSVRNTAIKRIGIDNCADKLVDDSSSWIRMKAIRSSQSLSQEDIKSRIESIDLNAASSWYGSWEILALFSKLTDEELLYYLDMGDKWGRLEEYIGKRLAYASLESDNTGV